MLAAGVTASRNRRIHGAVLRLRSLGTAAADLARRVRYPAARHRLRRGRRSDRRFRRRMRPARRRRLRTRPRRSSASVSRDICSRRRSASTSVRSANWRRRSAPVFPRARLTLARRRQERRANCRHRRTDAWHGSSWIHSTNCGAMRRSRATARPRVLLRSNTGVEAHTHAFVRTGGDATKFGIHPRDEESCSVDLARRIATCVSSACTRTSDRKFTIPPRSPRMPAR